MGTHVQPPLPPPPLPPPPPEPPSLPQSMPMFYYGLVVVGTAAIILAVYNFTIIRWCSEDRRRARQETTRNLGPVSRRIYESHNVQKNLVGSFKYKRKEQGVGEDQGYDHYECPVCLSAFEEGEELKQLPRCRHSFHAPCIDMWLFSHFDCPVCRAPVDPPVLRRHMVVADVSENSREGLLDAHIAV